MIHQPYLFFGGVLIAATAFCMYCQVFMFGNVAKGWIDRSHLTQFIMSVVALLFVMKAFGIFWAEEPMTVKSFAIAVGVFLWQFCALVENVVRSYKQHEAEVRAILFDQSTFWRTHIPTYRPSARQDSQRPEQ